MFSPVSMNAVAAMMAFGAGSLLFAVTVELYGLSLHETQHSPDKAHAITAICLTIAAACAGALGYLFLNRKLEEHMELISEACQATPRGSAWTPRSTTSSA